MDAKLTRAQVEDFLFEEADLLDQWKLEEWRTTMLTEDAEYLVPSNDSLEGNHRKVLFTIADNAERIRQRVIRLMDPNCHAEFPQSRTRRLISNVRMLEQNETEVVATANFICCRYRRFERIRQYTGQYRWLLRNTPEGIKIRERKVLLDAHELGSLGSVSFIL